LPRGRAGNTLLPAPARTMSSPPSDSRSVRPGEGGLWLDADSRIADVLAAFPEGIAIFDAAWRIVYLNDAAKRLLAPLTPDPNQLLGQVHWDAFPGLRGSPIEREYQRAMAERVATETDYFHEPLQRWLALRVIPVGRDELCVFFRDVHDQRMRDAELRRRAERMRIEFGELETIYRSAPLGLAVLSLDLRFLRINDYLARVNGPSAADHVGRTVEEVIPAAVPVVTGVRDRILATGESVRFDLEVPYPNDPGRMGVWDEQWYPLHDDSGRIVALGVVVEEVTERRLRERRLSEEALQLANAMPQLVWTAHSDGTVDYYNQRITDYSGAEREGGGAWRWAPMLHPDDIAPTEKAWREAVAAGRTYACTHRIRMRDGSFRWHLSRGVPLRNAEGKVVKWFGTATDIDEQKRAADLLEQTVAQRTARLQETIAELESFSYSISHDMRAPLRAMQTYARYLQEEFGDKLSGEGPTYLRRIVAASDRLDRLIRDVLDYSRIARGDVRLESIEIAPVIEELLATYPHFREVDVHVGQLPPVLANKAALTQCFSNLIGNAVKFVRPGETPRIRVTGETAGDFVRLRIADNGPGIAEPDRARIFEMFYQINAGTDGTGIGLSIVRKAAERMGGRVAVESSSSAGTTFLLELRRA
jgi:PAS domain S-box-containing protein